MSGRTKIRIRQIRAPQLGIWLSLGNMLLRVLGAHELMPKTGSLAVPRGSGLAYILVSRGDIQGL